MIASVAIHLALVAIVVVSVSLPSSPAQPIQPEIDTHISEVSFRFDPEESVPIAQPEPRRIEPLASLPQHASTEVARPPTISSVPNTLPSEFLAIIHRSQTATVPTGPAGPEMDPNVKPTGAISTPGGSPLHGAMKPGQSVVYVLDCSGSMGEFGKLALARAALIATLYRQPEEVRFQVILYSSTVRQLLPGGLLAIAANVRSAETKLATLEPAGRSNHTEALRMAVGLRSDAIVWLTDANDLSAAKLKPILNEAGKPISVYVAEVTVHGVGDPQALR
ncbi:MAG TPA: vWA domain-containing protein [Gemmata sp.]|jgi:hypothetical protein|nr:vWA domain-containing protein [Gemmata sp.]